MEGRRGTALRLAALALVLGAIAYAATSTPLGRQAFSAEGRRELVASIDGIVRSAGLLGPLVFVVIYAGLALFLPATAVTAAGAVLFGKYLGFACNYAGAVLSATLAFFLSRHLLRGFAARFLVGKLRELDEKAERHGFPLVFYLRMVFFPFLPLNYAAGITRIRFRDFILGTALGILPGTFIFSFFFGSIKEILASYAGPADLLRFDVLFPAALFVFSFFIPRIWARIFPRPDGTDTPGGAE